MSTYQNDVEAVKQFTLKYEALTNEIGKVIVGQENILKDVLICIFGRGHCLLVGVPGLAKTLLVNTISRVLGLSFSRIQFTPDLMPSDIIGSEILNDRREFEFIKGPLFANIVLADEINRTPPKTQSALLEAMQEKAVTAAGKRYELGNPFFVLATQTPIEQEGTYPLPEAQLDRFMFNVYLDYPTYEQELSIVKNTTADRNVHLDTILDASEIVYFQNLVRKIPVADNVLEFAVKLAVKTRPSNADAPSVVKNYLSWGAGPRASQNLVVGAKALALIKGKFSPDIEDVKGVAYGVLRHRIVRNYKAEADGVSVEEIINDLMK
ncbi:MAG: AAA family ATPase [Bacteroidota bacterium]